MIRNFNFLPKKLLFLTLPAHFCVLQKEIYCFIKTLRKSRVLAREIAYLISVFEIVWDSIANAKLST